MVSVDGAAGQDIDTTADPVLAQILYAVAGDDRAARTPEQAGLAVLAAAVGYHQREDKPFWWSHFDRLNTPPDDLQPATDVFVAETTEIVSTWGMAGRQKRPRRTLRLTGQCGEGSSWAPGTAVCAVYAQSDTPAGMKQPTGVNGLTGAVHVTTEFEPGDGLHGLTVEEVCPRGVDLYDLTPFAVGPSAPIATTNIRSAIEGVAESVADQLHSGADLTQVMSTAPVLQLLSHRPPVLTGGGRIPEVQDGDYVRAVLDATRRLDGSYLAVQGPPGSGKTWVGSRVIAELVEAGWRVGVVAQSHKVVENMLRCASEAGLSRDKIGKPAKADHPADADLPWLSLDDKALAAHLNTAGGCLIGGTAWDFTNRKRIAASALDLLVIDEAGQFSLANTIAVSTAAKRLLLLGDPQQLPQVTQGTHPEPCDESALAWALGDNAVMPRKFGYFLAATWRMHPALAEAVSRLSYDGQLHAKPALDTERTLEGTNPGVHVVTVQHTGNSVVSTEEAAAIAHTITGLVGQIWRDATQPDTPRPLTAADVLVVAPYNAQVTEIRRHLDRAGHHTTRVGTVDKLQGQEAPVVVVSMTASSPEDVPRGMDFLLSRNRVNVAVSRGQWCAIIVRSPGLTGYLPTTPEGLTRLGAFMALCESPSARTT